MDDKSGEWATERRMKCGWSNLRAILFPAAQVECSIMHTSLSLFPFLSSLNISPCTFSSTPPSSLHPCLFSCTISDQALDSQIVFAPKKPLNVTLTKENAKQLWKNPPLFLQNIVFLYVLAVLKLWSIWQVDSAFYGMNMTRRVTLVPGGQGLNGLHATPLHRAFKSSCVFW